MLTALNITNIDWANFKIVAEVLIKGYIDQIKNLFIFRTTSCKFSIFV